MSHPLGFLDLPVHPFRLNPVSSFAFLKLCSLVLSLHSPVGGSSKAFILVLKSMYLWAQLFLQWTLPSLPFPIRSSLQGLALPLFSSSHSGSTVLCNVGFATTWSKLYAMYTQEASSIYHNLQFLAAYLTRSPVKISKVSTCTVLSMWYSITLVIVVSLDSQLLNSGNLPVSISIPPPSTGLGNSIIGPSHAFQLAQLEVTSFCCLMSSVLNTVVSYMLPGFFVVSGISLNQIQVIPSCPEQNSTSCFSERFLLVFPYNFVFESMQ